MPDSTDMKRHAPLTMLLLFRLAGAIHPESIGPFGGSAAIVEVDPFRPDTALAATSNGVLFQSTNEGVSWSRLPFPAELRATLHALVITPTTGTYLVGMADDSHQYSGIFQSSDAGRHWTRMRTLQKEIWSIAVWPLDERVIAAGAEDGVFLTRDGGQSWRRISPESNPALAPIVSLAFDTTDSRILYSGTPHLPWRTVDDGETWQPAYAGMPDDSDVFSIHVDETRPLQLFASACSGMYRSTNQGASWIKLAEPKEASFRTYQITQDPVHPDVLFAGTAQGLVRSPDRGQTWRTLSGQTTRWITFDRTRPGRIFIATEGSGILRSDTLGEKLIPVNEGFCNRRVLSFTIAEDAIYASLAGGSTGGGIFRRGGDRGWESLGSTPQFPGRQVLKVAPVDSRHLYAVTSKNLIRSVDGGRTWTALFLPSPIAKLTTVLVPPEGQRLLVGTEDGIWYTDDGGKRWMTARLPENMSGIQTLALLGSQYIVARTRWGLMVSQDGSEFRPVAAPDSTSHISGLIATDRSGWLAATTRGLARSTNFGVSWQRVPGILDGSTVSAICKDPTRPGVLFASRYGAIFRSEDDGRSWSIITSEEGAPQGIEELAAAKDIPGAIFAVTHSQGIYMISTDTAVRETKSASPRRSTAAASGSGSPQPPF